MNFVKRIKNLYKLSEYRPEGASAMEVLMGGSSVNLVKDIKSKPRPATIVQDDPLDVFSDAQTD